MIYRSTYRSPLGEMVLTGGDALTGLWFTGGKAPARLSCSGFEAGEAPVFGQVRRWLDVYFSGRAPDFTPAVQAEGTPFQCRVWQLLQQIPYGETTTYGALAREVAAGLGMATMSAQAVGGAVGRNPVFLLIPCHRVVGADGSLTGYAGGLARKRALLEGERGQRIFFSEKCSDSDSSSS